MDNPFERYDLDPRDGIAAITQRLRELAEEARDDREREQIRAAWEELTLHPRRRLRAALFAHPETRRPLGSPPPLPRRRDLVRELGLRDVAARPRVLAAVLAAGEVASDEPTRPTSLQSDPLL